MALVLVPVVCGATVDRLATTYQPLYCPQEGIRIVPVYFLTMGASPDAEISMVCSTNALIRDEALPGGGNANLASLFHLSVRPASITHKGPASVTIDMTHVAKPEGQEYSTTQVLEATVQCLLQLMQDHGHTVMHIKIDCSKDKMLPEWKKSEKSYDLTRRESHSANGDDIR